MVMDETRNCPKLMSKNYACVELVLSQGDSIADGS